jgi:CCR4-NOT transcription complex subunit 1
LFKAINRIFIGLTHDYPEFLVQCHYQLVTSIPKGYTQLRNIILSATPSNVQVPDPFTSGLKVERLPEINQAPIVNYAPVDDLAKIGLKKPVDNFLRIPAPALMRSIYTGLKLNHPKEVEGIDIVHYNVKLINALVLHVGISAVSDRLPNNRVFNVKSSQVALLVDIMNHGSLEFKFHMINAIANQLRYPNSHTHWFVGIILHFFSNDQIWGSGKDQLVIQELITRVLLERRMVSKPHPWGLTIVFTELLKNGDYGFFDLQFVKNASPELTSVFNTLSINVKNSTPPANEQTIKAR